VTSPRRYVIASVHRCSNYTVAPAFRLCWRDGKQTSLLFKPEVVVLTSRPRGTLTREQRNKLNRFAPVALLKTDQSALGRGDICGVFLPALSLRRRDVASETTTQGAAVDKTGGKVWQLFRMTFSSRHCYRE